jgi:hypothetical protein
MLQEKERERERKKKAIDCQLVYIIQRTIRVEGGRRLGDSQL